MRHFCDDQKHALLRSGDAELHWDDDSGRVNVHGAFPGAWLKIAFLMLDLLIWLDAAIRATG